MEIIFWYDANDKFAKLKFRLSFDFYKPAIVSFM